MLSVLFASAHSAVQTNHNGVPIENANSILSTTERVVALATVTAMRADGDPVSCRTLATTSLRLLNGRSRGNESEWLRSLAAELPAGVSIEDAALPRLEESWRKWLQRHSEAHVLSRTPKKNASHRTNNKGANEPPTVNFVRAVTNATLVNIADERQRAALALDSIKRPLEATDDQVSSAVEPCEQASNADNREIRKLAEAVEKAENAQARMAAKTCAVCNKLQHKTSRGWWRCDCGGFALCSEHAAHQGQPNVAWVRVCHELSGCTVAPPQIEGDKLEAPADEDDDLDDKCRSCTESTNTSRVVACSVCRRQLHANVACLGLHNVYEAAGHDYNAFVCSRSCLAVARESTRKKVLGAAISEKVTEKAKLVKEAEAKLNDAKEKAKQQQSSASNEKLTSVRSKRKQQQTVNEKGRKRAK